MFIQVTFTKNRTHIYAINISSYISSIANLKAHKVEQIKQVKKAISVTV
jgi:hypothetical protein